jgi:hypothetical protein
MVLDYFNLIVRDYHLAQEKWNSDLDYKKELTEEFKGVDKEI